MKTFYNYILYFFISFVTFSCNDFLDINPQSDISPEIYFTEESHLEAFIMSRYFVLEPSSEYAYSGDNGTDNQIGRNYNSLYTIGEYKIPNGSNWSFGEIYNINWFLEQVLPKWEKGEISGNSDNIKHFIGEAYFFRAWQYFYYLKTFGDYPIVDKTYGLNKDELIKASVRRPRTDVIHFIIEDLNRSIEYMSPTPRNNKNTLWQGVAYLVKSRFCLYEASWLKYFKGTAFVPNGEEWPGKAMYPEYKYPKGTIDDEINWLYEQAIEAADAIASKVSLTPNSQILPQNENQSNDYLEMFGAKDLSKYDDVLLWKAYDYNLGVSNATAQFAAGSNQDLGLTKGLIDAFLMKDGKPIYASSTDCPYEGDNSITDVIKNRDNRMYLFVKQPGQINGYINKGTGNQGYEIEPIPEFTSNVSGFSYPTGYASRKGWNPDVSQWYNRQSSCGLPIFRATEAYLNYIEAYYERYGSLNEKADKYWRDIRRRGGVAEDYNITINNTDIEKESLGDWGAYSAGNLLTDKTLYNIRRERRIELMLEGLRWSDLYRWRSMDQMITKPYRIEGFKIWNSDMTAWYKNLNYTSTTSPNVTPPSEGDYVGVWEIVKVKNPIVEQGGLIWKMAHYLSPIGIDEFRKTSNQKEGYTDSPLYQNPYWSMEPETPAEK